MYGAEHREVLEGHLRRPIFTDRDAAVRPAQSMFARLIAAMRTWSWRVKGTGKRIDKGTLPRAASPIPRSPSSARRCSPDKMSGNASPKTSENVEFFTSPDMATI